MYMFRRDVRKVAELGSALMRFSQEQDYPYFIGTSKIYSGWALVQSGEVKAGLELCQQGTSQLRTIGAKSWLPHNCALIAECHAKAGDIENARRAIAEALDNTEKTSGSIWDAELSRIRGCLLMLANAGATEVEACFREALTTARRQKAKLLELRAATSFAEWLVQNGARIRAREVLLPIYDSFSEGANCADVREARVILDNAGVDD
jgi:predicted ATPase